MAAGSYRAGGKATMGGMAFQTQVSVWFAAQLIGQHPIGARFGIHEGAVVESVAFETRKGLDDIRVTLSGGCMIDVQCKTTVNLETDEKSALGKTIAQLVDLYLELSFFGPSRSTRADPTRVAAVLAVQDRPSGSIASLEATCRLFDAGADWATIKASLSDAPARALEVFEEHARAAWSSRSSDALCDRDLESLARLLRIQGFEVARGERDWTAASTLLGQEVFGGADAGLAVMPVLSKVVERLIAGGAAANRSELLGQLRARGQEDKRSPQFAKDLQALQDSTQLEVERIRRHGQLPFKGGVPLPRACMEPLLDAISSGSLLVTGEPGAGKTGVLVSFVQSRLKLGLPTVLLSVDRYPGISTPGDLKDVLEIDHSLLSVLDAWPGSAPGVLVIDALDASRGGPSEAVFASLISDAVAKLGSRWSIVASIRTFDLINGRRFQEAMRGAPPNDDYVADGVGKVRHFNVPRLTLEELQEAGNLIPDLKRLIDIAPDPLRTLLSNIFNLALAVDLLEEKVPPEEIKEIATQSRLIDRYEDARLDTEELKQSAGAIVGHMVGASSLIVRRSEVAHFSLEALLSRNVMGRVGDRVAFAHHILFDHVAGRFFLAWDSPPKMHTQVIGGTAVGFLLGPSIRFAVGRMWTDLGDAGSSKAWDFVIDLMQDSAVDPMTASIGLRTAVAHVQTPADVAPLCRQIYSGRDALIGTSFLPRLTRFVQIYFDEKGVLTADQMQAWSLVAEAALSASGEVRLVDTTRFLLRTILQASERAGAPPSPKFSEVARSLLQAAWDEFSEYPTLAVNAVGLVAAGYAAFPAESRALLSRMLAEPHFADRAYEEGRELAEKVLVIAGCDPDFVIEIYRCFFSRQPLNNGQTFMGGVASRIMPLVTDRKQDYQMVRWRLSQSMPKLLKLNPAMATKAVHQAVIGLAASEDTGRNLNVIAMPSGSEALSVVDDDVWPQDWRIAKGRSSEEGLKNFFVEHLRACEEDVFRLTIETSLEGVVAGSLLARILGVAVDRANPAADLLWPLVSQAELFMIRSLARDAILYVSHVYESRSAEQRTSFEQAIGEMDLVTGDRASFRRAMIGRLLAAIPVELLETEAIRSFRAEFADKGDLRPNTPFVDLSIRAGANEEIVASMLRSEGVDLETEANQAIYLAANHLKEVLEAATKSEGAYRVEEIWAATLRVTEALDAELADAAHRMTKHAGWGIVSNAVDFIARSDRFASADAIQPTLEELDGLIQRLEASPYPEPAHSDHASSWGNWDVRIYAATALMSIANQLMARGTDVTSRLVRLLSDPTPAVRLQIAQHVATLWTADSELSWSLADRVSREETHPDVLAYFISQPIPWMVHQEPSRGIEIVGRVLSRIDAAQAASRPEPSDHLVDEALGHLVTQLWVYGDRSEAFEWLQAWCADVALYDKRVWSAVSFLRAPLFAKYVEPIGEAPSVDPAQVQTRAREMIGSVLDAASEARAAAFAVHDAAQSQEEKEAAVAVYRAADQLISHVCDELFFGAGAFQQANDADPPGLADEHSMRSFLSEYGDILRRIGSLGTPGTLHHLFQLYAYLVPANPDLVFDEVAKMLEGQAAKEGYHTESLAADVLVAFVRRYLADYRSSFSAPTRRQSLVKVLELFSSTGWAEATKLLYDLPDLLR